MDDGTTIGVEEEFVVTDAYGRAAVSAAGLADVPRQVGRYALELHSAQIESVSAVHCDADGLRVDLAAGRAGLAAASPDPVLPIGWAPGGDIDTESAHDPRHRRVHERFRSLTSAYTACGCHVHVGVADRDTAVAVLAHLRPWLPTLVAVGANSPFRNGRDTGYASWRIIEQSKFPGAGPPPRFRNAREYDTAVAKSVQCGALVDDAMSVWLTRLSPRYPTVEVRAADVGLSVADSVFQAVLTRALVRTALDALATGAEGPDVDDGVLGAAVWTAARYGLRSTGVDVVRERRTAAWDLLDCLIRSIATQLDETGDRAFVDDHVRWLRSVGTGADRVRALGVSSLSPRSRST